MRQEAFNLVYDLKKLFEVGYQPDLRKWEQFCSFAKNDSSY